MDECLEAGAFSAIVLSVVHYEENFTAKNGF
jgi:hypothetical protein